MPTIELTDAQITDLQNLSRTLTKAASGLQATSRACQQTASVLLQTVELATTETEGQADDL